MKRFYSEQVNSLALLIFLKLMMDNRTSLSRSGDQDSEESLDDTQAEETSEESNTSEEANSEDEGLTRGTVDPARTRVVDPARTAVDPARTR